ncbi:MAG: hypothetical protein ACK4UU_07375 [Fimbriimonadales bacterium]
MVRFDPLSIDTNGDTIGTHLRAESSEPDSPSFTNAEPASTARAESPLPDALEQWLQQASRPDDPFRLEPDELEQVRPLWLAAQARNFPQPEMDYDAELEGVLEREALTPEQERDVRRLWALAKQAGFPALTVQGYPIGSGAREWLSAVVGLAPSPLVQELLQRLRPQLTEQPTLFHDGLDASAYCSRSSDDTPHNAPTIPS